MKTPKDGEVAALLRELREEGEAANRNQAASEDEYPLGFLSTHGDLCLRAAAALARLSAPAQTREVHRTEYTEAGHPISVTETVPVHDAAPVPALSDTLLNTIEALAQENFLREDYAEQCAYVLDFANRSQEAARNAATQIRALTKQHAEWVQAHQVDTDSAWRIVAKLTTEAKKLLALMPAIDPALGDETDRVFVWHEFDELRKAIDAAPVPDKEK